MARFTLDATGAKSIGDGLGNVFKALAMAPHLRGQAEQQAALQNAQIYASNMRGNQAGAKAQDTLEQMGLRKGEIERLDSTPDLPLFERAALSAFKLAGSGHVADYMKGRDTGLKTQSTEEVMRDPSRALPVMKAFAATSGKTPFSNAKADGYSLNELTGENVIADPVIAKIYRNVETSKANQHNAAASNSVASAGLHRVNTRLKQSELDNIEGGTGGKPLTNAQRRENQTIEAARTAIGSYRPEDVNAVMETPESMMTAYQKNIYAQVKLAQKPKFGEQAPPAEIADTLGLDPNVLNAVTKLLAGPQTKKTGFPGFRTEVPMTEEDISRRVRAEVPGADKNTNRYVDASRRSQAKNPAPTTAPPTMGASPVSQQANDIKQMFKAGKISREQAKQQLQQLGFK